MAGCGNVSTAFDDLAGRTGAIGTPPEIRIFLVDFAAEKLIVPIVRYERESGEAEGYLENAASSPYSLISS